MKATIYLFDEISFYGISAKDFANTLKEAEDKGATEFEVHLNSPGGSVFDGLAIYNLLKVRNVTVIIDGIAASIASVIAMAGKKIIMHKNTMMMIHNPSMIAAGDIQEFEKVGMVLDMVKSSIITAYVDRTNIDKEKLSKMMDEDTWLTAEDAKRLGFCNTIENVSSAKEYVALYVNYDHDSQKQKGQAVNKQLLLFLGLPENATDEQITARLKELRNTLGLAENATLEEFVNTAGGELLNDLKAIKADVDALKADKTTQSAAAIEAKAEALVDSAINAGKILPADKDTFVIAAKNDFDKVKAALDAKKEKSALPGNFSVQVNSDDKKTLTQKAAEEIKNLREGKK